ncbi:hypothetical protein AAOE16_09065 [Ekhidna sp. MALMAid0563]|uniref:hypothetical protein n=1 Tax=Ekhidna sp. MALMAid0563 TaxID=3143937 RepID=UPI0032DFD212
MKRILAGVACCFVLGLFVQAQSIYSFEGLGSLNHQGMPNNVAMGEVGIGTPTIWHINTQNPANLVYNTFSTFQVGLEVDRRNFSGEEISGTDTDGGLRFLGYAFPIMPDKWSSSFGILPYSSVSYNTFSEGEVAGTNGDVAQISDNRGEGGLTNFFWANGFKIKNKFLVGVRATYTFGSIEKSSTISIGGNDVPVSNVTYEELESYSDLNFLFGVGYRHKLAEETFINFGATFSPKTPFNGTSELSLIRLSNSGSELETVNVGTQDIQFDLPGTYGFGVSYQKLNKYTIGFDVETQGWESAGLESQTYNNSLKIALGLEWTPDYDNVSSYWKRAKYSAGLNYHKLPYIVNNQALTDFGINFGASLPVSGFSSLDLAFKWGQLGKSSNGLIKETYYKVVIGATINDRWFIKRKYD